MSEHQPEDDEARNEAEEMLQRLPLLRDWLELLANTDDRERRAFIIEFAGMPKSGKSSAIENLRHFFSHGYRVRVGAKSTFFNSPAHRYEVYTPAEGVSLRTPSFLKSNLVDYNTWAGAYGLQELLRAMHDTHNDLVILDRGPWDAGCWLEYWKDKDPSRGETVAQIAEFFHLGHWITCSDLHVVLTIDPATAVAREQSMRLIEHGGFASESSGMEAMRKIYVARSKSLAKVKAAHCPHLKSDSVLQLDTTSLRPLALANRIIRAVFAVLEAKINSKDAEILISLEFAETQALRYLPKIAEKKTKTSKKRKNDMLAFLKEYVVRVNKLSPAQRLRWKREIELAEMPENFSVAARAAKEDDNPLKNHFEELLRRVRST